jgi:glycopeptide antibiotics resistance protein
MWKKLRETAKKKSVAFLTIPLIIYISFTQIIPRYSCTFLSEQNNDVLKPTKFVSIEPRINIALRTKFMQDIMYHKVLTDWNTNNVTKIILNTDGKVMGYKIYKAFYPNYFTTTQLSSILKHSDILNQEKSNLHTLKISFSTV